MIIWFFIIAWIQYNHIISLWLAIKVPSTQMCILILQFKIYNKKNHIYFPIKIIEKAVQIMMVEVCPSPHRFSDRIVFNYYFKSGCKDKLWKNDSKHNIIILYLSI